MRAYLDAVKHRTARALGRALIRVAGGVFLAIGAAFLIAGLWIVLEQAYSALAAAFILAAIFIGLGLILIGVATTAALREARIARAAALRDAAARPGSSAMPPLAEAFFAGLNAAIAARRRPPPPPPPPPGI